MPELLLVAVSYTDLVLLLWARGHGLEMFLFHLEMFLFAFTIATVMGILPVSLAIKQACKICKHEFNFL